MYVIPMTAEEEIQISDKLDEGKNPSITVVVPGTTLFNMKFEQFVEMVTDYAVKNSELAFKHQ